MRWRLPLLVAVCMTFAQPLQGGWIRTYEVGFFSIGYSVRQTLDSGYIVVGVIGEEEESDGDLLMIKIDSLGDTLWTRIYGGGGNDVGKCVQQTKDSGYIITGYRNGGPDWPAGDLWLIKIDSEGDMEWDRVYGGIFYSAGKWVEQTSDGGYIITGSLDQTYLWILKVDEQGYKEWENLYEWGDYHETGYCIRPINDGYIIATNMGLFKTDDKGDSMWMKPWAGHFVALTSEGGYFVLTGQNNDMWLIKTDEQGDTLWTKTYGGGDADAAWSAQQTLDGGYIIVGETRSFGQGNYDVWLLKTDANGDTLWTRTYGGEGVDWAYSVQQTLDSGYIITGMSNLFSDDWAGDVWLIKTDSLGYVGVEEPVTVTRQPDWEIVTPVGQTITLRYESRPQGFHASIFNAAGQKVDEVHSASSSGSITWGESYQAGVYFTKESTQGFAARVIIIH